MDTQLNNSMADLSCLGRLTRHRSSSSSRRKTMSVSDVLPPSSTTTSVSTRRSLKNNINEVENLPRKNSSAMLELFFNFNFGFLRFLF